MAAVDLAYSQTMPSATERASLPPGWSWTTLGEVTLSVEKVDPSATPDRQITYLDISSIDNVTSQITEPKTYSGANAPSRARQLVRAGDVLFSTVRTYLKNIAQVPEAYDGQIASTGFSVLRSAPCVSPKYLFYYTLTESFLTPLAASQRGTSYPAVRDADVREQPFPLAPLPEQQRIILAIETHFTRLDAGVAALRRVQANLRRYRVAVLKAACEGKLAPTEAELARAEGRDYEPADVLLKRILAERRAKWVQENPKKKYVEPAGPDVSALPELPEGWCWAKVGGLFDVNIGSTPPRQKQEYWNGDVPWVSSGEVAFSRIRITKEKITRRGLLNSSVKLNPPGTVLLAMIGEGKTRGQAAILDIDATNNQNSAAIRVSETPVPPEWVFYWLMAQYEQTRRSGAGGMQYALNSKRVQSIPLPLAPLNEMHRIVNEIQTKFSNMDASERMLHGNLVRIERLRQSILGYAFAGMLVKQQSDTETLRSCTLEPETATPCYRPSETRTRFTDDGVGLLTCKK